MAYTYQVASCDTHAWHVDTPYYAEYDDDNTVIRDGIVAAFTAYPLYSIDGKFRDADRNEHYGDVPDGLILNVQPVPPSDEPYDDLPF